MICCICNNEFDQYEETTIGQMTVRNKGGHDPSPVKEEGRCCTKCNFEVVIPKRLEVITNTEK